MNDIAAGRMVQRLRAGVTLTNVAMAGGHFVHIDPENAVVRFTTSELLIVAEETTCIPFAEVIGYSFRPVRRNTTSTAPIEDTPEEES